MLDSIKQWGTSYYDALPSDIVRTVGASAILTFAVRAFFSNDMSAVNIPLINAGIAATASLIHALTTPVFKAFLPQTHNDDVFGEIAKNVVVLAITTTVMKSTILSERILKISSLFGLLSLNALYTFINSNNKISFNSVYLSSIYA